MKKKKFDAIKMSRDIRKKLSKEYVANPEKFFRRLKEAHERFDKSTIKNSEDSRA